MSRYYYLIASLPEIQENTEEGLWTLPELQSFCQEQLSPNDYDDYRRLFIWNDIKNATRFRAAGDPYITPAYYTEEEFLGYLEDRELLLPFLRRYFQDQESGAREYNNLSPMDELVAYFYQDMERVKSSFLKDYFHFELNLRNCSTALSLRGQGLPYADKLIPFGAFYENLTRSSLPDFGITPEWPVFKNLAEAFETAESVQIEKVIDQVRWEWASDYQEKDYFSFESLCAYTLKHQLRSRWVMLSPERGQELFSQLAAMIKRSVRFSIEILTAGDKK